MLNKYQIMLEKPKSPGLMSDGAYYARVDNIKGARNALFTVANDMEIALKTGDLMSFVKLKDIINQALRETSPCG